jgi:hypothetical protein
MGHTSQHTEDHPLAATRCDHGRIFMREKQRADPRQNTCHTLVRAAGQGYYGTPRCASVTGSVIHYYPPVPPAHHLPILGNPAEQYLARSYDRTLASDRRGPFVLILCGSSHKRQIMRNRLEAGRKVTKYRIYYSNGGRYRKSLDSTLLLCQEGAVA